MRMRTRTKTRMKHVDVRSNLSAQSRCLGVEDDHHRRMRDL
jgi:hypothetical protein